MALRVFCIVLGCFTLAYACDSTNAEYNKKVIDTIVVQCRELGKMKDRITINPPSNPHMFEIPPHVGVAVKEQRFQEMIGYTCSNQGIDLNQCDSSGIHPLLHGIKAGSPLVVMRMIENMKTHPELLPGKKQVNPLVYATEHALAKASDSRYKGTERIAEHKMVISAIAKVGYDPDNSEVQTVLHNYPDPSASQEIACCLHKYKNRIAR